MDKIFYFNEVESCDSNYGELMRLAINESRAEERKEINELINAFRERSL